MAGASEIFHHFSPGDSQEIDIYTKQQIVGVQHGIGWDRMGSWGKISLKDYCLVSYSD